MHDYSTSAGAVVSSYCGFRDWSEVERHGSVTVEAYVPGEVYPFDWSHAIVVLNSMATMIGGTCPALP